MYAGLFVSPFLAVFAVSVVVLIHVRPPSDSTVTTSVVHDIQIPAALEGAEGLELVRGAASILGQTGVSGEINFIRSLPEQHRLIIPVVKPGSETTIDFNFVTRSATVSRKRTRIWERFSYLHKMPGPHNALIRGNWFWTRAWRWFADATVYLTLFLSLSGIYLWAMIRSQRKIGLILLSAGAISFGGVVYAIIA